MKEKNTERVWKAPENKNVREVVGIIAKKKARNFFIRHLTLTFWHIPGLITWLVVWEKKEMGNEIILSSNLEKPEALPALLLFLTALKTDMAH